MVWGRGGRVARCSPACLLCFSAFLSCIFLPAGKEEWSPRVAEWACLTFQGKFGGECAPILSHLTSTTRPHGIPQPTILHRPPSRVFSVSTS
jgi:hypothetical protein